MIQYAVYNSQSNNNNNNNEPKIKRKDEKITEQNYFEHYKILKSFIKNLIPTNKYIHNQTLKFNLKINGKSKNQKWCAQDERAVDTRAQRAKLHRVHTPNTIHLMQKMQRV